MFDRNAAPIANVPPYKRIGVNDLIPAEAARAKTSMEIVHDVCVQHEAKRIWGIVVQTAEGTNAPMPMPEMPD